MTDSTTNNMKSNKIRLLRKSRKMTQADLGELLGLGPGAVGNYERGGADPSLEHLIKMADFFEVSVDYLIGRTDIKNRPDDVIIENDKGITVMEGIDSLQEDVQEKVGEIFEMVKAFYKKEVFCEK